MALSAKLKITVKNPLYPSTPGEFSTVKIVETIDYDPLFKHLTQVPITLNVPGVGQTTLICEVRNKKWKTNLITNPSTTVAVYDLSPFGVKQSNGEIY